jgi:hypothetical protein
MKVTVGSPGATVVGTGTQEDTVVVVDTGLAVTAPMASDPRMKENADETILKSLSLYR